MATLLNSKTVSIVDDTFNFKVDGDYTIDFSKSFVQVKLDGGQNNKISDATFLATETFDLSNLDDLNINGITFGLNADKKFESNVDLHVLIAELLETKGVAGTLDSLTVNGNQGDAFKLVWDELDDNYTYYNTAVNDAFIDLGIAYADYLKEGGAALTDTIVKFTPDGADSGSNPDRSQSLHDNILGNLSGAGIADKFDLDADTTYGSAEIIQRIEDAGWGVFLSPDARPYYGGYEGESYTPTHNWDVAHDLLI